MIGDHTLRQLLLFGLVGSVLSAAALYFAIFPPSLGRPSPPRTDIAWTQAPARVAEPARPAEAAPAAAATLPPPAPPVATEPVAQRAAPPAPAAQAAPAAPVPAAAQETAAAAPAPTAREAPAAASSPEGAAAAAPSRPTVTVIELRRPVVLEGLTLAAGTERIRLAGVRPFAEDDMCLVRRGRVMPCDELARRRLGRLVRRRPVVCVELGVEAGLTVARCEVGGRDLAEALIATGAALPSGNGAAAR